VATQLSFVFRCDVPELISTCDFLTHSTTLYRHNKDPTRFHSCPMQTLAYDFPLLEVLTTPSVGGQLRLDNQPRPSAFMTIADGLLLVRSCFPFIRYDATEGPSCSSTIDQFVDKSGNCQCAAGQTQNTPFGCTGLSPSGSFTKRSRQATRARVQLPGRPIQPQY
jgi:hypothetical protein